MNWYAYANNNPVDFTDPTGLSSFSSLVNGGLSLGGGGGSSGSADYRFSWSAVSSSTVGGGRSAGQYQYQTATGNSADRYSSNLTREQFMALRTQELTARAVGDYNSGLQAAYDKIDGTSVAMEAFQRRWDNFSGVTSLRTIQASMDSYRNDVGLEGAIPVYGSARQAGYDFSYAYSDFAKGDILGGLLSGTTGLANSVNSVTDVVGTKALLAAGGRLASKVVGRTVVSVPRTAGAMAVSVRIRSANTTGEVLGRVGPQFDPARLERVLAVYGKKGTWDMSPDAVGLIRSQRADAMYWHKLGEPGTLLYQPNPTRLEVIEELIHFGQARRAGFPIPSPRQIVEWEIEAQDRLLRLAQKQNWSGAEMQKLQTNRAGWVRQLESVGDK